MVKEDRCDICGKNSNQDLIPINTIKSRIHTVQVSRNWTKPPLKVCYKCYDTLDTEREMSMNGITYMAFSISRIMKKIQDTTIPFDLVRKSEGFIENEFKGWYQKNITALHRVSGLMWLLQTKDLKKYESELIDYIKLHHSNFQENDIENTITLFKKKFPNKNYNPFA
jgi:hypothetical protein